MPEPALTVLKRCRHGNMLFLRKDQYVGRSLDLYGEFSPGEGALYAQLLRPGHIAIDVGANVGAHTLHFAQLVGPTGKVFAFEPQRVIFQLLCANMMLNERLNVHAFHAAAGRSAGTIQVPTLNFESEDNFGSLELTDAPQGETVPLIALDSLEIPALRLLKIDAEGMEADVLAGAQDQIARHRPFLYVENDRQERSPHLITLISTMGYTLYWHLPVLFDANNFFANGENVFGALASINLFCTPSETNHIITAFRPVTGPEDWYQDWPHPMP